MTQDTAMDATMQDTAAYTVRTGYVYTDVRQACARVYAAGEQVVLPVAVGDAAHHLERAAPAQAWGAAPAQATSAAQPKEPAGAQRRRTAQLQIGDATNAAEEGGPC